MSFFHIFNKPQEYLVNPFADLFTDSEGGGGSPPVTQDRLLKEDSFAILKEDGDHLLLE